MIKVLFEAPERIDLESEDYFLDARNVSEAEFSDWLDSTGNSIRKIWQSIELQEQEELRKHTEARQKSFLFGFLCGIFHPVDSAPCLTIYPYMPEAVLLCREEQLSLIWRKGREIPGLPITAIVRTGTQPVSVRKTQQEQTETAWKG